MGTHMRFIIEEEGTNQNNLLIQSNHTSVKNLLGASG